MLTSERIEPLLTVKRVSELLHVHRNTVRRWSDGGPPACSHRVGLPALLGTGIAGRLDEGLEEGIPAVLRAAHR